MEKVSTKEITLKFNRLSEDARKEVYDFMSYLIAKQRKKKKPVKDKLLDVSVWKSTDIKAIENVTGHINKWTIEKF